MTSDAETLYAFRRNLVVAASAGTGKTHALVGVLVHLVLGASELGGEGLHAPVDPGRIVATTFRPGSTGAWSPSPPSSLAPRTRWTSTPTSACVLPVPALAATTRFRRN